jgi:hypothetical protein
MAEKKRGQDEGQDQRKSPEPGGGYPPADTKDGDGLHVGDTGGGTTPNPNPNPSTGVGGGGK